MAMRCWPQPLARHSRASPMPLLRNTIHTSPSRVFGQVNHLPENGPFSSWLPARHSFPVWPRDCTCGRRYLLAGLCLEGFRKCAKGPGFSDWDSFLPSEFPRLGLIVSHPHSPAPVARILRPAGMCRSHRQAFSRCGTLLKLTLMILSHLLQVIIPAINILGAIA